MRQIALAALLLALVLPLAACGGSAATAGDAVALATAAPRVCPKAWRAGWQRLADRIDAPVYCPTWMPQPLDAKIGGEWGNGEYVDPDGSYLVSFVWQETGPSAGGEVHVNFRGYPGSTRIPVCQDTLTVNGKTVRRPIPCFSDARGTKRLGAIRATVYTANQGADQWHVLYAWRFNRSLYAVSEHVAPPFTYRRVVQNLDRLVRGLVLVRPQS